MKKGKIFIDSDGFFWPSNISNDYMREQRKGISFEKEYLPPSVLFEQFYLGFRSSLFVCEEGLKYDEGIKILNEWREACVSMAHDYTTKYIQTDLSLPVDFMWIVKSVITDEIQSSYPNASKIPLMLSMRPMISARVKNKKTIVFPALIRSILNHCNLVLINQSFEIIDNKSREIDRRYLARFIIPYLLFCHDDFSVSNLPIIGGYSEQAILTALSYTNIQVLFIFAHEYAHILLYHFDNKKNKVEMENEADTFALNIVLKYINQNKQYTENDVFTSIRWLFKYQLLEERIGSIIRGNNINYFSNYEKRRSSFQTGLIQKCSLTGSTLLDAIGFSSIVELQNIMSEYGLDLINKIIETFNNSKKEGRIEPWWEMIAQK